MTNTVKASIAEQRTQGIFEQDATAAADARAKIRDWNEKNPESRIVIDPMAVAKRVREMRKSKAERVIGQASKSMRGDIRESLK